MDPERVTLSLSDIDRWSPEAIDAVSRTALTRADDARNTRVALGAAMALLVWDGETASAARAAVEQTMLGLDEAADTWENLGRLVAAAAGEVAAIKARLQPLRDVAVEHRLRIDPPSATVRPPSNLPVLPAGQQDRIHHVAAELTDRIAALLRDAANTDADLAAALASPVDPLSPAGSEPFAMPVPPTAATPADVNAWWQALSPAGRATVERWSPDSIRNLDGIPAAVRNELNTAALPLELQRLRNGWLDHNGTWHTDTGQLADLTELTAILREHPELRLLLLDTTGRPGRVLAAVAAGDVDQAQRIGVTVPGMNAGVRASLAGMATEAIAQRDQAVRLRGLAGLADPEAVATVAWLGYPTPGLNIDVTNDRLARAGARSLNRFFHGLAATTTVADQHITALGHSYGSVTTSLALQQGAPVSDVVLYGSPGAEITDAAQLRVAPGHAYFEVGMNDLVPTLAQGHRFGPSLRDVPGLVELSTRPGYTFDGAHGDGRWHQGAYGHSEYARPAGDGSLRMSGYNMAAVVAGLPEDTIEPPPPLIPPGQGPIVVVGP